MNSIIAIEQCDAADVARAAAVVTRCYATEGGRMSRALRADIVGVGTVGAGRFVEQSLTDLADRAVAYALEDAGVRRAEVDGLLVHIGSPRGLDYDTLGRLLNLRVGFAAQSWAHGRFTATVMTHAALAVSHGLASTVVVVGAFRNTAFAQYGQPGFPDLYENLREGGGPHGESPRIGLGGPVGGAALVTRRYLHAFGVDREALGEVALSQRAWAELNPAAVLRKPLSETDYRQSPYIVEPLRRLDCSIQVDTATAVVVTTPERAAELRGDPVHVLAAKGLSAGPDEFIFGQPGLGVHQNRVSAFAGDAGAERLFADAGADRADIGAIYCYDGFSIQVPLTLERFSFCKPGTGLSYLADRGAGPGGELPVNTNGGQLSEGHTNGWGHTVEIVRQLRGQAGDRQVPGIRCALWATTLGDAIVYAA